jgi:glycosyltransferase involved in cell wall biosynthesis
MNIYLIYRDCFGGIKQYNCDLERALLKVDLNVVSVKYTISQKRLFPRIKKTNNHVEIEINQENIFFLKYYKKLDFEKADILLFSETLELSLMKSLGFNGYCVYVVHGNSPHYSRTLLELVTQISGIVLVNKKQLALIPKELDSIPLICSPHINESPTFRMNNNKSIELIFVGRISYAKGIDLFIELCKQIPGEKLIIASGEDVDARYLSNISEIENLTILYNQSNQVVLEAMSKSKFLIHPSRSEGFGIVIIEAIKNGAIPIVLEGSQGPEEILSEFNSLIIRESDYISKTIDIYKSIFEGEKAYILSRELQEIILKKYNSEYLIQNFKTFISKINSDTVKINSNPIKVNIRDLIRSILKVLWRKLV